MLSMHFSQHDKHCGSDQGYISLALPKESQLQKLTSNISEIA